MAKRKPKENTGLREFICEGRLSLDGVVFTIMAASQEEAEERASAGQWCNYALNPAGET